MRLNRGHRLPFVIQLLATFVVAGTAMSQPYADESPAQRDARMGWWRDARFGMFIHWGVYSVPAGEAWISRLFAISTRGTDSR